MTKKKADATKRPFLSPELVAQWHPTKNEELTPNMVRPGSSRTVWWLGPCGHEWKAQINSRSQGTGCPYCKGNRVAPGFNDLATINPELAAQWHPTRNGNLKPHMVRPGSNKKVWWLCPTCEREWEAIIKTRSHGIGCPSCAGRTILPGVNDLTSQYPELAAQWHPTRNGSLKPHMVKPGNNRKVWWLCPICDHEWEAVISNRAHGTGCPECNRQKIKLKPGVNDLATVKPDLAAQWHPTKNGILSPCNVTFGSLKTVWWLGPCGHEWDEQVG